MDIMQILSEYRFTFAPDQTGLVALYHAAAAWVMVVMYSVLLAASRKGKMRDADPDDIGREPGVAAVASAFVLTLAGMAGIILAADTGAIFLSYIILSTGGFILIGGDERRRKRRVYLIIILAAAALMCRTLLAVMTSSGKAGFAAGGYIDAEMMAPAKAAGVILCIAACLLVPPAYLYRCRVKSSPAFAGAGVFCLLRIIRYVFTPALITASKAGDILGYAASVTIIICLLTSITRRDVLERYLLSSVSVIGTVIIGTVTSSPFASAGVIVYGASQMLLLTAVYMCLGAVCSACDSSDLRVLRGSGTGMPAAVVLLAAASVGAAGMPVMQAFPGLVNMVLGAVAAGRPVYILAVLAGAVLFIADKAVIIAALLRRDNSGSSGGAGSGWIVLIPAAVILIVSMVLGIYPDALLHISESALEAGNQIFSPLML